MKKLTFFNNFFDLYESVKPLRTVYLKDPEKAEKKPETGEKSPLGLFVEHKLLMASVESFVAKNERSLNPKIHAAAEKARAELKRIKHGEHDAEWKYFPGDEKFKTGVLDDIKLKLKGFEKDVDEEKRLEDFENTRSKCIDLANKSKSALEAAWKEHVENDKTIAGLGKKAKTTIELASANSLKKQTGLINDIIGQISALDRAKDRDADGKLHDFEEQLTGKTSKLKNKIAAIYDDFKMEREVQVILDIARKKDTRGLVNYFFDNFNKTYKSVQNDTELEEPDRADRINKLNALKKVWTGDSKNEKGKFYTMLEPYMRNGDVRNRAYVLAELNDDINAVVRGKEPKFAFASLGPEERVDGAGDFTGRLMGHLKDGRLAMEARKLESLQYNAGEKKERAKNWPSDKQKAADAVAAYAAFEKQAKLVYALRTPEKRQKPEPPKVKPDKKPQWIAQAEPKKSELPERKSAKKAA